MEKPDLKELLSSLPAKWTSTFVERQQVGNFSGGLLNPKYMANLDSQGKGPENTIKFGRKRGYYVPSLITWMLERAELLR